MGGESHKQVISVSKCALPALLPGGVAGLLGLHPIPPTAGILGDSPLENLPLTALRIWKSGLWFRKLAKMLQIRQLASSSSPRTL